MLFVDKSKFREFAQDDSAVLKSLAAQIQAQSFVRGVNEAQDGYLAG